MRGQIALWGLAGLLAAGAVGLAVGYYTLGPPQDPLVARVGEVAIRQSTLQRQVTALPLGQQIDVRQQPERFAEAVIREEVLFQYAREHLYQYDPAFRQALRRFALEWLFDHRLPKGEVGEQAIRDYYHAHLSEIRGEHVRVRSIRRGALAECRALLPELTDEAAFAAAARRHHLDEALAERGGDMGYLMRHFDTLGFEAELFDIPLHQPHIFQHEYGCHLVWVSEHLKPPAPPLAAVRDAIGQVLAREAELKGLNTLFERALQHVTVERY